MEADEDADDDEDRVAAGERVDEEMRQEQARLPEITPFALGEERRGVAGGERGEGHDQWREEAAAERRGRRARGRSRRASSAPKIVMMNAPRASQLRHCGRTRIVQKRSGRLRSPARQRAGDGEEGEGEPGRGSHEGVRAACRRSAGYSRRARRRSRVQRRDPWSRCRRRRASPRRAGGGRRRRRVLVGSGARGPFLLGGGGTSSRVSRGPRSDHM